MKSIRGTDTLTHKSHAAYLRQARVHYYKSNLIFPGFTDPEIRQLSKHAKFSFGTHILYDNNTDMMNSYNATLKNIENCIAANHKKSVSRENADHDKIWWDYKKVTIALHYYISGGFMW
ncbi:MAG: hypothetical protein V4556_13800 [Bacteroidota bacterium]